MQEFRIREVRIRIEKDDPRSKVLGETITAYLESERVDAYLSLIKKTFPSTKIKLN